jgi:hypothetical protein
MQPGTSAFRDRVRAAAEAALEAEGAVGPIELLQFMQLLHPVHVESWRKGHECYRALEPWIQVGPEKFQKTLHYFGEWVKERGLSAVEVPYTRRTRHRYERQGLLVSGAALAKAEEECAADAPERAVRRAQAAESREVEDRGFIQDLAETLRRLYPMCPPSEAQAIAEHTGLRGSGRVGRSAAGRDFDTRALALAVRAHIRHTHTN